LRTAYQALTKQAYGRFVLAVRIVAVAALVLALGGVGKASTSATRPVSLRLVEMLDARHGYALSGNGVVNGWRLLQTADGGHVWRAAAAVSASSPVTIVGGKTRFFSTTLGKDTFAVERSDDGGGTWHRSRPFRDAPGPAAVGRPFAIDGRHLYVAVGEGAAAGSSSEALFTSSDGGRTWRFATRTSTTNPHLLPFGCDKNGFGFATPTRGWAGAYCAGGRPFFYRTDDGGRTWRPQVLSAPQQCACETSAPRFFTSRVGVLFIDGFAGFTANGGGQPFARVYWTSDGGEHWRGRGPAVGRTNRIAFSGDKNVWLTGQKPGNLRAPFDRLFRTTDAGATWQTTKLRFDASNYLFDPISGTTAFAAGSSYDATSMLVTRDGGRSWRKVATVLTG
jgi:photosystem II stability/assembly factor-like uncharacterized protein